MNPAVHVLIECFLCGLKFAPQPPTELPCPIVPVSASPLLSRLLFVKQLTDGEWMKARSCLTFVMSPRGCASKQTVQAWQNSHTKQEEGNGSAGTFPTKLTYSLSCGFFCILSLGKQSNLLWGGEMRMPKIFFDCLFFHFFKAQHLLETIVRLGAWRLHYKGIFFFIVNIYFSIFLFFALPFVFQWVI